MLFYSNTNKGLQRQENQDALGHIQVHEGTLFIVCDGISGLPNGAKASHTALKNLKSSFSNLQHGSSKEKLKKAMQKAQIAVMKTNPKPLGTTIATCFVKNKTAHISWCGDSRVYHFRKNEILWMTKDHNILHDILNKPSSKKSFFRNPYALNRFFGRNSLVESDYNSIKLEENDHILLCTDGLTNFISENEILNYITTHSNIDSSKLLENKLLSNTINAPDNFTWYIIKI